MRCRNIAQNTTRAQLTSNLGVVDLEITDSELLVTELECGLATVRIGK